MACLLHCYYLSKERGYGIWREVVWALVSSDVYPAALCIFSFLNPARIDYDGSIAGISKTLSVAAPYEQLVEDLMIVEQISTGLE